MKTHKVGIFTGSVSSGWYNKMSQIGRLTQQTFISHGTGSCKSEIKVLAHLKAPFLAYRQLPPLCILLWQTEGAMAASFFCKGTNPIVEVPPL